MPESDIFSTIEAISLGSTVSLPQTEDPGVYFVSEFRIPESLC
jgi:hypothetical protein